MGEDGNSILEKLAKQVDIQTKLGLEGFTALVILTISLIFCHIFVIPLDIFKDWPKWLLNLVTFIAFWGLRMLLFSSDVLYQGDPSKCSYVRAFQKFWPSRHLMNKFNLTESKANFYWFEIFNKWSQPNNPRHNQRERTLRRGYRCRFVYYCIKFFELLLAASAIALLYNVFLLNNYSHVYTQVGFGLIVLLLYILLRITNRTSPNNLKGVWRQYAEINQNHIEWIDHNFHSLSDIESYIGGN